MHMATGSRIRHYRLKMGWTLDQLSERTGVETGTISALEQRDSARSSKFLLIAPAFGLTVEQLSDVLVDHRVYDAHAPACATGASQNNYPARQDASIYMDAWMEQAIAALHKVPPDLRAETMSYLEWQVGRKPRPHQSGNHLPLAA